MPVAMFFRKVTGPVFCNDSSIALIDGIIEPKTHKPLVPVIENREKPKNIYVPKAQVNLWP